MALAAGAAKRLQEDKPPVKPPKSGKVSGTVTPPDKIKSIRAVSRTAERIYKPDRFDETTGEFVFEDLPGDARYDIRIATPDGRIIEGIDLDFTDRRLLRLAEIRRKQLGLPPPRRHKFTKRDARDIIRHIETMEDFMDFHRPLYVKGHGKRATALVEMMRTRPFHQSDGDIIWRVELWYFKHAYGGWELMDNQERVLERIQAQPREGRQVNIQYYPQLSVYLDPRGKSEPVSFSIPEKPDVTRGRTPNTPPKLKTEPHILGLSAAGTTERHDKDESSTPASKPDHSNDNDK